MKSNTSLKRDQLPNTASDYPSNTPRTQAAGREGARKYDDAPEVAPQGGLEVQPGNGLIVSRDDEKIAAKRELLPGAYVAKGSRSRRLCGLRPRLIWVLIGLLAVIAIAVGVGVGVGVSRHHGHTASAGQTTTPSPQANATATSPTSVSRTSSASASSATTSDPASQCKNGTIHTTSNNTPFSEVCNTDFNVGGDYNTTAADLDGIQNVDTFASCMEYCANDRSQGIIFSDADGTCLSVTWISADDGFGLCYLKNATALIGSGNKTALMEHALPREYSSTQSANIIGDDGQPL
ncbi:MAG: hypothetical protein Q9227_004460 [Pyrenula ochraceoflavens]